MCDIFAFGDSILKGITYGNGIYRISRNRFSDVCSNEFGVSIVNKAKFGSTVIAGECTISKNINLIKKSKSKYVILEFGGNDCDHNWVEISNEPGNKHFPKVSIEKFVSTYSNLIAKLRSIGKMPVLLSLPPINPIRYFDYISRKLNVSNILKWMKGNKQIIYSFHERYNIELFKLAIDNCVPIIDITSKFLVINNFSDFLCNDGIHPNNEGHSLIADSIKEHVYSKKIKFS